MDWSMYCLVVALNLRFLAGCAACFNTANPRNMIVEAMLASSQLLYLAAGLIAAYVLGIKWIKPHYRTATLLFLGYMVVIVVRSDFPPGYAGFRKIFTWLGPMAFLYPVLIFCGAYERLWRVLHWVLTVHVLVGVTIVLMMRPWSDSGWGNAFSLELGDLQAGVLLSGWPLLLLQLRHVPLPAKVAAIYGLVVSGALAIVAEGRGALIVCALLMLLAAVNHKRFGAEGAGARRLNRSYPPTRAVAVLLVPAMILLLLIPQIWERLSLGVEGLTNRWDEDNRSVESEIFIGQLTVTDWAFGRGALGHYDPGPHYGGEERIVVDVGWLCLVLKGGLVLAALVIILPLRAAIDALRRGPDITTAAAAGMLLLWMVRLTWQGFFSTLPTMVLLWLCLGRCLRSQVVGGCGGEQGANRHANPDNFIQRSRRRSGTNRP